MKRPLMTTIRLGAVLAAGSLLAIGGGSVHAGNGVPDPDITGTIAVNPASTTPGTTVAAAATFTNAGGPESWKIGIDIEGTDGAGTLDLSSVAPGPGVTGCALDVSQRLVECDWSPTTPGEMTTISININVAASATPASPGWLVAANAGPPQFVVPVASTHLEIVDPPVDPPVTDPPVTDPPVVDPPVVDPPTANPPASGGTPTQLPATGNSTWPLVLIGLAALVAGAGALRLSRSR